MPREQLKKEPLPDNVLRYLKKISEKDTWDDFDQSVLAGVSITLIAEVERLKAELQRTVDYYKPISEQATDIAYKNQKLQAFTDLACKLYPALSGEWEAMREEV